MRIKTILYVCFLAGMITGNAQGLSDSSKNIDNSKENKKEAGISFPTTLNVLTGTYGKGYEELSDASTGKNYYKWIFDKGLVLVFVPLTDTEQYIGIVAPFENEEPIGGLSFNLIFNQTTLEDSRKSFSDYAPDWTKIIEEDSEYYKLSFKKDDIYNYLYFYENSKNEKVLKAMTISTMELE